jgi:hypothetical protein
MSNPTPQKPKLEIASEKTRITFEQKMKDMKRKDMERLTAEEAAPICVPYIYI